MDIVFIVVLIIALLTISQIITSKDIKSFTKEPCLLHQWKSHDLDPSDPSAGRFLRCDVCNKTPSEIE